MAGECLDCTHASLKIALHGLFPARFFQSKAKDRLFVLFRNNEHPVHIAEENATRLDTHSPYLNWNAKIVDFVSRSRILRVGTIGEGRKLEPENSMGVAHITIENSSASSELACASAQKLSP